jgi:cell division protein FtsN
MKNLTTTQRGSTTLGIIVGVVLGLAVALGVSLYLANSGAPLQTKAANAPARIEPPKDLGKAPDPNEALYTKVPKVEEAKVEEAKPTKEDKTADSEAVSKPTVTTAVPTKTEPAKAEPDAIAKIAAVVTPAPVATATKPLEPVAMPKPATAAAGGERYFVQAGAFSNVAEAEALKAKLALAGVTMNLSPRDKDGQILQRVRTAPLAAVDAEKLRNNLKANGIETSLVKVQ